MPVFSPLAKNIILDGLSPNTLSLHTAYDPTGGAFEVTGGTPAYVRLSVVFGAASSGTKSLILAPYTFDIPATTVAWIGIWNLGIFLAMCPNGGDAIRPFSMDDLTANTLKSSGHGFLLNDTLVVWQGSAGLLPVPLAEGQIYYVVAVDATQIQLATSLGGAAIGFTSTGNGYIQRIIPDTRATQDQFVVNAMTLDATVAG